MLFNQNRLSQILQTRSPFVSRIILLLGRRSPFKSWTCKVQGAKTAASDAQHNQGLALVPLPLDLALHRLQLDSTPSVGVQRPLDKFRTSLMLAPLWWLSCATVCYLCCVLLHLMIILRYKFCCASALWIVKSCASSLSSNDSHASHACFARVEESSTPRVRFTPGHSRYDCTSRSGRWRSTRCIACRWTESWTQDNSDSNRRESSQIHCKLARLQVHLIIKNSHVLQKHLSGTRNEYRPTNIAKSCRHHSPMLVSCRKNTCKILQNQVSCKWRCDHSVCFSSSDGNSFNVLPRTLLTTLSELCDQVVRIHIPSPMGALDVGPKSCTQLLNLLLTQHQLWTQLLA